jgi:hypothetical protein
MNPRIKELASQCWDQRLYGKHFDQEMFAQLIVLECARVIADDDLAKDCDTFLMDSYAKGMRYSAHLIKEHFGIEA